MLKLMNIHKEYQKRILFDKESLCIKNNGCYLIKGKNGCGKTTLLNVISKVTSYRGKVDSHLDSMSYLFQHPHLLDYLTIKEHFDLFGIDIKVLEEVQLASKIDEYPSFLSMGEKQRIGILLNICSDTNLVLLDEPFANIDKRNIEIIANCIKKQSMNKVVLIVSHDYNDIIDYDGVISIKNTKIIIKEKKRILQDEKKGGIKRKFSFINKYRKHNKKILLKFYLFISVMFLFLGGFSVIERIISTTIENDINRSVDYNKYYLKTCSNIVDKGFKVNKCINPSENNLKNIKYGYNYDYLLNYLYNNSNLSIMSNKDVVLTQGVYPRSINEVIADETYNIGDTIAIESRIVYQGETTEFYTNKLILKVVGIYYPLSFYREDKIYMDYNLLEEYFKNEYFLDSQMSLYEFYKNLEIDNYKYVSFEKVENDSIIFVGEKFEYYKTFTSVFNKVRELLKSVLMVLGIFFIINFYRMYRSFLDMEARNISFLLVNSFEKRDVLNKVICLFVLPMIFLLLISIIACWIIKIRLFISIGILLSLMIVALYIYTYMFFNRKKLEKYIKVKI